MLSEGRGLWDVGRNGVWASFTSRVFFLGSKQPRVYTLVELKAVISMGWDEHH